MRPNFVLVTLDCVRQDYLGCYGARVVKTPNIDSLAEQGVLIEKAYTHCPVTAPAHLSLFTSKLPHNHGIRSNARKVETGFPTMAEFFRNNGYQTAAFVGSYVFDRSFGFDRGFDYYDDAMLEPVEALVFKLFGYYKEWGGRRVQKISRNASRVTKKAIRWLKSLRQDKPFFVWFHYFDAHDQFRLPLPLHLFYFGRRSYQQNIEYIDCYFGKFLRYLKKTGLLENTVFIITSDHGESLNDHQFLGKGYRGHSAVAYEVTLRTPLIFCGPDIARGKRIKQLFRQVDILPTVLEYMGLSDQIKGDFEGESLLGALKDKSFEKELEVYAETLQPTEFKRPTSEWRVLIKMPWKYIFKPQAEEETLYNLEDDPGEGKNVLSRYPEIAQRMKDRLLEIIKDDKGPMKTDLDEKVKSALEALGYM